VILITLHSLCDGLRNYSVMPVLCGHYYGKFIACKWSFGYSTGGLDIIFWLSVYLLFHIGSYYIRFSYICWLYFLLFSLVFISLQH